MTTKTGGPAFPVADFDMQTLQPKNIEEHKRLLSGMTLRDYFAAKSMQGYLANPWQAKGLDDTGDSSSEQMRIVAEISYAMADAMLKARSTGEPHD